MGRRMVVPGFQRSIVSRTCWSPAWSDWSDNDRLNPGISPGFFCSSAGSAVQGPLCRVRCADQSALESRISSTNESGFTNHRLVRTADPTRSGNDCRVRWADQHDLESRVSRTKEIEVGAKDRSAQRTPGDCRDENIASKFGACCTRAAGKTGFHGKTPKTRKSGTGYLDKEGRNAYHKGKCNA